MTVTTCQFCEKFISGGRSSGRKPPKFNLKVQYGPRHHAHVECLLDAKGVTQALGLLHDWQIAQFPWLLIKERGIEKQVKEAIAKAEGQS